ncbi:hypothetical protein CkaCkLH20_03663 [Colletotrichum karsti]|uniref:Myb-like domain-containing protein n=1 Tax=Colletotrichum karsti TaxID=1095194 RepID=A0A9P6I9E3_9PEZI|nr:uncharacterized protein CkaCkLH20_03663 [Colletotrichum karsti]KAF9878763.1 hypothetical protein CkaCkLH20_03663 [Colletotrichum karsti]
MVRPQFRQLDVESMGQLCKRKERKQKLARLKRQREREEQQHQSHLPPTALPTPLESDVGTLVATEAQTIGFASAGFGNLCGIDDLAFNFIGIDWNDNGYNIAHTLGSFEPPSGIGSITTATTKPISLEETKSPSAFWSPWTPPIAQPPTEQTSREESNILPEELLLVPDLALIGRGAEPPDSERGLDMLQLFLGFISDYATKRLPHNATSARNINRSDVMNGEQVLEATVELPNSKTFKNSDSSEDNSGEDSDSEKESASSDRSDSPGVLEEMGKRPQRRRWTSLDELRLRAWVQEEKKWSWIAGKLQRSEQAIIQHWKIMGKRDKKTTK